MDDITIVKLLKEREKLSNFHGVFGKDELKNIKIDSLPYSIIVNEDDFVGGRGGTHWVAIYIDEGNRLDFYDSFGEKPKMKELTDFIRPFKMNYNKVQVQADESSTCGQHCIFFLIKRTQNVTISMLVNKYFNVNNKLLNDLYVYRFVQERYGLS